MAIVSGETNSHYNKKELMAYKRKTRIAVPEIPKTHQEKFLERFKELMEEMYETTRKKNHDYASPNDAFRNFRDFGSLGVLVRMSDKFARLKTALAEKRQFLVPESIKDTTLDLAVYSLILIIMTEEGL